jgi:iron complex transport system substrate-binding protein
MRTRAPGIRRFLLLALACALGSDAHAQAQQTQQEFFDEVGRRVLVPMPVRRIVSLAPSLTETVYALGAQDRLVGVTDYCDYPADALAKPKVGGAVNPSIEQIVALKPDVVLATRALNRRETVEALERLGVAVYATDPHSVEGVLDSTRRVAEVLGVAERAEALVVELRARLDELQRRLATRPARRVLFVVWHEPLISIGRETFLADALRRAGAESVVETAQDWPKINLEEVARLQPEYLVFASAHSETVQRTTDELRERPGWRALEAVQRGRFAVISDAVNRPSPRLVAAIEELARQLHPEAFTASPENGKGKMEKGRPQRLSYRFPFSIVHFSRALPRNSERSRARNEGVAG